MKNRKQFVFILTSNLYILMAIVGIVAVDRQGAIGRAGRLAWHYKADLQFFKEQTTGHACVMGRTTWLSLARPLPDRLNIILSRRVALKSQPDLILHDPESIIALAPYLTCDVFIIGGAQIYAAFLDHIERWIVTEIPLAVEDADTFMPNNYLRGFALDESRDLGEGIVVRFYTRRAAVENITRNRAHP